MPATGEEVDIGRMIRLRAYYRKIEGRLYMLENDKIGYDTFRGVLPLWIVRGGVPLVLHY